MALKIVGTGPGNVDEMTARARRAIEDADIIVGYTLYNELLQKEFPDKEYYATPMRHETERCRYALEKAAQGAGDKSWCAAVTAAFTEWRRLCLSWRSRCTAVQVRYRAEDRTAKTVKRTNKTCQGQEICPEAEGMPGITAALSGGARLGSPLSNDFAVVSLSDLLTPWDVIKKAEGCG